MHSKPAKLARGTRWSLVATTTMAVAAVGLASACEPLPYGCHRTGSHGGVTCIKQGGGPTQKVAPTQSPAALPSGKTLNAGSSWS